MRTKILFILVGKNPSQKLTFAFLSERMDKIFIYTHLFFAFLPLNY
jgi:hypothetical protein